MSSEFGKNIKTTIFGESHGKAIGAVVDGIPAGEEIDMEELLAFMSRRRPGKNKLSTARKEADMPIFLSGIKDSKTTGFPIAIMIENTDTRSSDYAALSDTPRPAHADYTAFVKWAGNADMRGGGHFSGRLTAPLCAAGGMAKQILQRRGIYIGAHLRSVGTEYDDLFPLCPTLELFNEIASKEFPVISDAAGERMQNVITKASENNDSVGGVIECAIIGLPAGIGGPMFEGVESRLASVIFGIPAVKGIEFGSGFAGSLTVGSKNNDPFIIGDDGTIKTETNNCGGILGGITNSMPVVFSAAIKPTPSISAEQRTVSLSEMKETTLSIKGRHDPCIAHRAVPVVEAAAALVILDMILEG